MDQAELYVIEGFEPSASDEHFVNSILFEISHEKYRS